MTTMKEAIEKKFEFDETRSFNDWIEWYEEHGDTGTNEAFLFASELKNNQMKQDLLPILLECVEALEFYIQPRMIYEPGKTRPCEITHESDYQFYPNHDVALESLSKLEQWARGG